MKIKDPQAYIDKTKEKIGREWEIGKKPDAIKFDPNQKPPDPLSSDIKDAKPTSPLSAIRTTRKLVVVECPWNPENPANVLKQERYSNYCILDSLRHGEAPYFGYQQFNLILNARISYERDISYLSHASWIPVADLLAVYIDHGITPSMQMSINVARVHNTKIEYRIIGKL